MQFQPSDYIKESPNSGGRPRLSYDEGCFRLKHRLACEVSAENDNDVNLLAHATAIAAKKACLNPVEEATTKAELVP